MRSGPDVWRSRSLCETSSAHTGSQASAPMRWFSTTSASTCMPAPFRAATASRYSWRVPYFVRTLPFWSNSPRSYRSYTP